MRLEKVMRDQIRIRVSREEKTALTEAARKRGQTLSDLLRAAATEAAQRVWSRHKAECRPIGPIVADARAGTLPSIKPLPSGFGFEVLDEDKALAAMLRGPA